MQGYFQDPEATARAFEGGYFHTGDLAVWHADGSVQIQDRCKDIIISGGEVCHISLESTISADQRMGQNASSIAIEQGGHRERQRSVVIHVFDFRIGESP
jgi:long-subunit acyl-CoA synthetase (AMP-forming)